MLNSPASLSLRMLRAVLSRMASIREVTSGSLGGGGGRGGWRRRRKRRVVEEEEEEEEEEEKYI